MIFELVIFISLTNAIGLLPEICYPTLTLKTKTNFPTERIRKPSVYYDKVEDDETIT